MQDGHPEERMNEWSLFCQLWMGNLVVYIHLWLPVCTRQQQATATLVAIDVSYPPSGPYCLAGESPAIDAN